MKAAAKQPTPEQLVKQCFEIVANSDSYDYQVVTNFKEYLQTIKTVLSWHKTNLDKIQTLCDMFGIEKQTSTGEMIFFGDALNIKAKNKMKILLSTSRTKQ